MDKKRERVYAFITVLITVPCFVFYCLSIENGGILNVNWQFALILIVIEFILAFLSEILFVGPLAFKIASKDVHLKNINLLLQKRLLFVQQFVLCVHG